MESNMNEAFNKAYKEYKESKCDWLSFIGCPMIYDGNLCVIREKLDKKELILLGKNKLEI